MHDDGCVITTFVAVSICACAVFLLARMPTIPQCAFLFAWAQLNLFLLITFRVDVS